MHTVPVQFTDFPFLQLHWMYRKHQSQFCVCVCVSVTPVRPPAVRRPLLDPAQDPAASRATWSLHDNRNPLRPQPLERRPRRRRRKEGREDGRERERRNLERSLAPFACLIMKMPHSWGLEDEMFYSLNREGRRNVIWATMSCDINGNRFFSMHFFNHPIHSVHA